MSTSTTIKPTFLQTATPLYPPPPPPVLTPSDLTSFYSMDRAIFSRLVAMVHREPMEAFRVMALWLHLERKVPDRSSFMQQIALLPDHDLSHLADETAACLHSIESDFFHIDPNHDLLPLMQEVSHAPMRLSLFHQNRRQVLEGVCNASNRVCIPALGDILRQCYKPGGIALIRNSIDFGPVQRNLGKGSRHGLGKRSSGRGGKKLVVKEMKVWPEDRTIFLTFSKGYPVTQEELVNFFRKVFGDIFECIKMQEVGESEQSLFANMIMRKASLIPTVLNGQAMAKFNINGKHVWARKFVAKNRG